MNSSVQERVIGGWWGDGGGGWGGGGEGGGGWGGSAGVFLDMLFWRAPKIVGNILSYVWVWYLARQMQARYL